MGHGTVRAVNVSPGGVPKRAIASAWIDASGVEGDQQRNRQLHGGPDRAVCLYSLDLIEKLQAEGHPIAPGTIGENLTLAGIDWSLMVPGAHLQVGPVLLELTRYTNPCRNISASFLNAGFVRVSQKVYPGWSRLYARVLEEGLATPGVSCEIRPAGHL
ncbi:MAG TPA: MOSC domain-containing protein [Vicinamibacterales bacterium]